MSVTPILEITELAVGQVDQFATANAAFRALEAAANAVLTLTISGAVTLTKDQFLRNAVFVCQGHTAAQNLTVLASMRKFTVHNKGTSSGVLNVVLGSTSIALAVGSAPANFYTDGTANGLFKIG